MKVKLRVLRHLTGKLQMKISRATTSNPKRVQNEGSWMQRTTENQKEKKEIQSLSSISHNEQGSYR